MNTEIALRFGKLNISGASSTPSSSQQRVKLSRGGCPKRLLDRKIHFATTENHLSKIRNEGNTSGKLQALGLSLRAKDQSEGKSRLKSATQRVEAAKNTSEMMSTDSLLSPPSSSPQSTLGAAIDAHIRESVGGGPAQNLSDASVSGPSIEDDEERMKRLQALAALRQSRILDSRVFRQTYVIRSYEVCANGTTSIENLLSLFQDVALNHVSLLGIAGEGFGATLEMNRFRLIWVITRLHVEVERYPTWPEAVDIDSWTDSAGKNSMRRDWLVRERGDGKIIARATSTWAMMNQDTRRLSKMPDDVRVEIEPTFVKRHAMGELSLKRVPKLDNTAKNIQSYLTPAMTDLDLNHHISYVTYVRWVRQSTPVTTLETHELSSITLEFRRESNKDDIVESLTNLEQDVLEIGSPPPFINSTLLPPSENSVNGSLTCSKGSGVQSCINNPAVTYMHALRMQVKGEEIVRGRTVWKRKDCWQGGKKTPQSPS